MNCPYEYILFVMDAFVRDTKEKVKNFYKHSVLPSFRMSPSVS